jgi:hypothetical protein
MSSGNSKKNPKIIFSSNKSSEKEFSKRGQKIRNPNKTMPIHQTSICSQRSYKVILTILITTVWGILLGVLEFHSTCKIYVCLSLLFTYINDLYNVRHFS